MSTITAILEAPADGTLQRRLAAFARLRDLHPFREINDPLAWQRELRADVKLPGRD